VRTLTSAAPSNRVPETPWRETSSSHLATVGDQTLRKEGGRRIAGGMRAERSAPDFDPRVPGGERSGAAVTAVSRGRRPVAVPDGVRYHRADLEDPGSLRRALVGADAMFLLMEGAGANLDGPEILKVATTAGVKRIVLQSSQAVGTRPGMASHAPLHAIEDQVRQSTLGWTILRPGGFASNAFAWADSIRSGRTVAAPFGDVGLPVVDPDDIAAVAAIALQGGHDGQTY
jgi:uncharacterized protein YbjT (DUF2867 family)